MKNFIERLKKLMRLNFSAIKTTIALFILLIVVMPYLTVINAVELQPVKSSYKAVGDCIIPREFVVVENKPENVATTVLSRDNNTKDEEIELIVCEKKKMFTTTTVNLRQKPNIDSKVLKVLNNSTVVTAHYNPDEEWILVEYKDMTGYIYSKYLKEYNKSKHIDIGLEYEYQDLIRELIDLFKLDVDEYFFYGMMYTENRFKQEPESVAGAQGILQIIPSTWRALYPEFCKKYPKYASSITNDPMDKKSNIVLGIYYIKRTNDGYGHKSLKKNSSKVLTTYNRGPYGAKSYYKRNGTYSSAYSKEILRAAEYIRKHKRWKEGI